MKSVSSRLEPAPTCCERYVPPGRRTRAISGQTATVGCRLTTRSNDASRNGRPASSSAAITDAPSGRRFRFAAAMFGGHDSVAASIGGGRGIPASTSPPPVWTSSAAAVRAIRFASSREYPHRGRSSVARPSNQEKSQPSSGTDPPSASSCPNVGTSATPAGSQPARAAATALLWARSPRPEPGEQVVLGDRGPGGIAGPDEALPAECCLGDFLRDLAEPRVLYLAGMGEQGVPLAGEHRLDVDRGGDAPLGLGHLLPHPRVCGRPVGHVQAGVAQRLP